MLLKKLGMEPRQLRPPPASWARVKNLPPEALAVRVDALVEHLGLSTVKMIAKRCPHLLTNKVDTLVRKLEELNVMLAMPRERLMRLVARFPSLLGGKTDTVHGHFMELVGATGRPEAFVAAMVACQPVVLALSPATVRSRVQLLHEAASLLPNVWGRELDRMSPAMMGRLLRASEYVLLRLVFTYLRAAMNGRKFHQIRTMGTIICRSNAAWQRENPTFHDWVSEGRRLRDLGLIQPWSGWHAPPSMD